MAGTTTLPVGSARKMRPWFKTIFPASAVAPSAFSIFNGMCGMSSWSGATNGLPTRGTRILPRCRSCPRSGRTGPTRWPCAKTLSFTTTNAAEPKPVTAPSAGRRCPFPGTPTTTKRDAVSVAAIRWCSRLWGAQAIFKQISIMLIWSSGAGMDLSFGNSGRTEPTERIPCRTASPIGMSSGVRFMTAPAKSVPITGGCTASGKHAGSREAPAITLIMVINPAGYMERLCPAWRKKNFVKPAWPSGYEAIRSLILKNTWQSGKGFPRWSRSGRLDCSG